MKDLASARWNLATTVAMIGWLIACSAGAVLVGYKTMYLGHLIVSAIVVYGFSTLEGARFEQLAATRSLAWRLWSGAYLGFGCFALGAIAMLLVNLGLGLYDYCCSDRFAGEFGLGTRTVSGTLWYAFAKPLWWTLLLGALPAVALGVLYGALSYVFARPATSRRVTD
jgi:hypothetical protein